MFFHLPSLTYFGKPNCLSMSFFHTFFILLPFFIYPVLSIRYFILILEHFPVLHCPLKSPVNSIFFLLFHFSSFIYLFIYRFQQEHPTFPVHNRKPGRKKATHRLMFRALEAGECLSALKKGQPLTTDPHLVRQTLKSFDYPLILSAFLRWQINWLVIHTKSRQLYYKNNLHAPIAVKPLHFFQLRKAISRGLAWFG